MTAPAWVRVRLLQSAARMAHRPGNWLRLLGMAAVMALAVVTVRAQGPQVAQLLGAARTFSIQGGAARSDTLRATTVSVDPAALAADVLDIAVTPEVTLRATLDRRELLPGGGQAWAGHVPGDALSAITLVSQAGAFQGSIRTTTAAYSIEPSGAGYVVRQLDTSLTPPELAPIETPAGAVAAAALADPPIAQDDGSTLDVLVLYTPGARTSAGGTDAAVQARIALGVTETNTGYANSGITPRLRLVGTQLLAYTEAGMNTDLTTLRANASVIALRDATGADLVTLIVADTPEACGLGYLMNSPAGFAPYAFNVVAYQCISPNYSFGHELGHNMGSTHAPEDGGGPGYYGYSYGYKHPARLFRTVMAYDCSGGGCPRVLHFSNPGVNYSGAPTGTAAQHNNALSINNNAMTVANFRQAVVGATAPTISAIGNVTIAEDGATSPIGFTVGDAESSASSLVVSATSSNTALVPNTTAALTVGGSGASRTLVVTPAANQNGSATITVVVSDGGLTASRTFTLTVTSVNDPPVVSRTPASATVAPGVAAQTTVTVTDIDSAGSRAGARHQLLGHHAAAQPQRLDHRHRHHGQQPHVPGDDDPGGRTERGGGRDAERPRRRPAGGDDLHPDGRRTGATGDRAGWREVDVRRHADRRRIHRHRRRYAIGQCGRRGIVGQRRRGSDVRPGDQRQRRLAHVDHHPGGQRQRVGHDHAYRQRRHAHRHDQLRPHRLTGERCAVVRARRAGGGLDADRDLHVLPGDGARPRLRLGEPHACRRLDQYGGPRRCRDRDRASVVNGDQPHLYRHADAGGRRDRQRRPHADGR